MLEMMMMKGVVDPDPFASSVILDVSARSGVIADKKGRVVTNTGGVAIATTGPLKNGNPAMVFNGTNWLSLPNNLDTALWMPADFCIDCWLYLVARVSVFPTVYSNYATWPSANGMGLFAGHSGAGADRWSAAIASTFPAYASGAADTIPYGSWFHYATDRKDGVIRTFIAGKQIGSFNTTNALYGAKTSVVIGNALGSPAQGQIQGRYDRFRITSRSRYSAAFTPIDF